MKNITKKQLITLIVLIIVLILVIAVQYFYRPVLKEKKELSENIDSMSVVYNDMKMLSATYSIDLVTYEDEKKLLDEQRASFLPYMTDSEQDNMLTKMLVSSGFDISSSSPKGENAETVELRCSLIKESKDNKEDKETKNTKDSKNDKKKTETLSTEEILAVCPDGARIISNDGKIVTLEYKTGEFSREMSYSVNGTYSSIVDFIRKVCAENSIEITSLNFSSGNIKDKQTEVAATVTETISDQPEIESESSENDDLINDLEEMLSENNSKETTTEKVETRIVENGIYEVELTIKVYMYDRNFNWGTDESEYEEISDESDEDTYEETEYAG